MGMFILIETITVKGIEWGISSGGPNPNEAEYTPCASKEEATTLIEAVNSGNVMAFLHHIGAIA